MSNINNTGWPKNSSSTVGTSTGYVAGGTVATFHSDDKYTGAVGATSYTINGVITALKNAGILAQ